MSNEPEFETVISEADVEAGAIPVPATMETAKPSTAPVSASSSSGWSVFSLTGIQKVLELWKLVFLVF